MNDPIQGIFGGAWTAAELFAQRELVATHGAIERFPTFMFQGPLESVESLVRSYQGALEVARGSALDGLQTGVSGVHASALLQLGLTVYFPDLRRAIAGSGAWLRELEASLGLPECASLMAFVNAPGSGLSLHHDRYDQMLFQIRGEKQFRYAANDYVENPDVQFSPFAAAHADFPQSYRRGFPLTSQEVLHKPFQTLELRPGSAFFMPSGTWHTTAEQTGESLSLVVAVRAPSRLDVMLTLLRYYASQSPEWRSRPYGGWSANAETRAPVERELERLLQELAGRLPELSGNAAFNAWSAHGFTLGLQREYPRGARFERFVRLPNSSLRFASAAEADKLSCVVRSGPTNRPQAETVLALNAEARPIIEWILASHAAFSVEQLAEVFDDFAREDIEDLLGWLARAALIRPLVAPEWDAPRR